MFWFWYFKGLNMKLDPHILWRYSWERQKLFWVHFVRSHSLWRAKLMSLGRQDWDPALSWISCSPQENPWAPLWLSSPRWENTPEQAGRMEQGRAWSQQVQQSSPGLTGAPLTNSALQPKVWVEKKRFWCLVMANLPKNLLWDTWRLCQCS